MNRGDVAACIERKAIDRIGIEQSLDLAVGEPLPDRAAAQKGGDLLDARLRTKGSEGHGQRRGRLADPFGKGGKDLIAVELAVATVEAIEKLTDLAVGRSEERRVGRECDCTCRSRGLPNH